MKGIPGDLRKGGGVRAALSTYPRRNYPLEIKETSSHSESYNRRTLEVITGKGAYFFYVEGPREKREPPVPRKNLPRRSPPAAIGPDTKKSYFNILEEKGKAERREGGRDISGLKGSRHGGKEGHQRSYAFQELKRGGERELL